MDKLEINLDQQLLHMIKNPGIYKGSKLIEKFLIGSNCKYSNIYDLVIDSDSGVSENLVCKFIDIFGDSLNLNSHVIQYILCQPIKYNGIQISRPILRYLEQIKNLNEQHDTVSNVQSNNLEWLFYLLTGGVLHWV